MQGFLRALRENGEITVTPAAPPPLDAELEEALRAHDALYRREIPPGAPALDVATAYWALLKLYQACQLLAMRDAPPALGESLASEPYDGERTPASDYAVDLAFQYLPSLFRLAERAAPQDPMLDPLRNLAAPWPLSSVGIDGVPAESLPFWDSACLRRIYIDRVIAHEDLSRMENPAVAAGARSALGAYPELSPRVAEFLEAS